MFAKHLSIFQWLDCIEALCTTCQYALVLVISVRQELKTSDKKAILSYSKADRWSYTT